MRKLVLPAALVLLLLASAATAHDHWIRDGRFFSPVDGSHCCGEHDCFELKPDDVSARAGGYFIHPLNELVPAREVQWSRDGNYWRCRRPDGSRRCFFAPPPSM